MVGVLAEGVGSVVKGEGLLSAEVSGEGLALLSGLTVLLGPTVLSGLLDVSGLEDVVLSVAPLSLGLLSVGEAEGVLLALVAGELEGFSLSD